MFDILVRIQSTELSDIQYKSLKYTHDLMIANSLLPGCWSYIKNIIELPRNPVEILYFQSIGFITGLCIKIFGLPMEMSGMFEHSANNFSTGSAIIRYTCIINGLIDNKISTCISISKLLSI